MIIKTKKLNHYARQELFCLLWCLCLLKVGWVSWEKKFLMSQATKLRICNKCKYPIFMLHILASDLQMLGVSKFDGYNNLEVIQELFYLRWNIEGIFFTSPLLSKAWQIVTRPDDYMNFLPQQKSLILFTIIGGLLHLHTTWK